MDISAVKEKAGGVFQQFGNYERFKLQQGPQQGGYDAMVSGDDGFNEGGDSPCSFDEIERPPLRGIDKHLPAKCPCIKTVRYTVAIMTCLGFMISFGMKCNVSIVKLNFSQNDTGKVRFRANWTTGQNIAVDSSFFIGYLITQIPAGFLASMFPASQIFGLAIATSASINILNPIAIYISPYALAFLRVLQGLVEGVIYPACHGIWRFWAPPLERSRLATIAFNGTYLGIVVGLPLSAILTDIGFAGSFLFYGFMGIVWYASWLWLVFEKPCKHPAITVKELKYIEKSLGENATNATMPNIYNTPFKDIFNSMPVIAIIVANFCRSWNFYMLTSYQSSYFDKRYKMKMETASFLGALPHICMTILVPIGGLLADHLRKTGTLSTTQVRKLFNCGGFGMEGIFLIIVGCSSSEGVALFALTIGVAFSAFAISGYNVNHLDIAPRYASILMGLSNGIGTTAGIFGFFINDLILGEEPTNGSWTAIFVLGGSIHILGAIFYAIFASGDVQYWAEPVEEEKWTENGLPVKPTHTPVLQDTAFGGYQTTEINQAPVVNYGATEHVTGNPFLQQSLTENTVQPEARDTYMYGNVDDRNY